MATANKSTGLQIALVFTVMTTIIALVVAFLQYRAATDSERQRTADREQHSKTENERQKATTDLQSLKQLVGLPNTEEVGKPDADNDNSVIGQTKALMVRVAPGDLAQPTISATLLRMGQEIDSLKTNRNTLNTEVTQLKDKITGMQAVYQKMADSHDEARKRAEQERQDAQTTKEEAVVKKDKEVNDRQTKIMEQQAELQQVKADATKSNEQKDSRINNLEKINVGLRTESDRVAKTSFEVPSGKVEWVDLDTQLVWINRGSRDGLRKGTTFSVYKQVNKGVARGVQDIKGSIEITKVGHDMSEARITKSQVSNPMVGGDPIYTPLWAPNRKEKFAFVGLIDLDNDGVNDRDVLHELVAASNAEIADEVDDKGVRHPANGSINVGTKFLVVGRIPDSYESKPDEKEAHRLIGELHKKMVTEAQEHGVRVVNLDDFLNYIGYEPGRRVWRPGVTQSWNLRQGMRGNVGRPDAGPRIQSMGKTSRSFTDPTAPQMESTGQTTKAFNSK